MTVRLRSMRGLQRDKSGCKDPSSLCEEGSCTAYRQHSALLFSAFGEYGQDIMDGHWKVNLTVKQGIIERTCWVRGSELGLERIMGKNIKERHPNLLVMPRTRGSWLLQGHCWNGTSPFVASQQTVFWERRVLGELNDHRGNITVCSHMCLKTQPRHPETEKLMWEWG